MDTDRLQWSLKGKAKAIYALRFQTNEIDDDELARQISRVRRVQQRVTEFSKNRVARARRRDFYKAISVTKSQISAGKHLMCFDIEGDFAEIGISTYEDGHRETVNIQIQGRERSAKFTHGPSLVLHENDAAEVLISAASRADFYVGHSLKNDFDILKNNGIVLPRRPFHDTAWLSSWLFGEMVSLENMCRDNDVDINGSFHVGGNDAHYNIELLLRLVEKYA